MMIFSHGGEVGDWVRIVVVGVVVVVVVVVVGVASIHLVALVRGQREVQHR